MIQIFQCNFCCYPKPNRLHRQAVKAEKIYFTLRVNPCGLTRPTSQMRPKNTVRDTAF